MVKDVRHGFGVFRGQDRTLQWNFRRIYGPPRVRTHPKQAADSQSASKFGEPLGKVHISIRLHKLEEISPEVADRLGRSWQVVKWGEIDLVEPFGDIVDE